MSTLFHPDAALPPGHANAPARLLAAADLQDNLMMASNDLDRLQTLLAGACDALMHSFHGAIDQLQCLRDTQQRAADPTAVLDDLTRQIGSAVTALQFQDMASQLIVHTNQRLRHCADQIASDTMGDDDGDSLIEAAPQRPNPVTQDEMDAGSIELF